MVESEETEPNSPSRASNNLDLENLPGSDPLDNAPESHRSNGGSLVVVEDETGNLRFRRSATLQPRKQHLGAKDLDPSAPVQPEYLTRISSVKVASRAAYFRKVGSGDWSVVNSPQADPIISAIETYKRGRFRGVPLRIPDGDLKAVCFQELTEVDSAPVEPTFKVDLRMVAKRGQVIWAPPCLGPLYEPTRVDWADRMLHPPRRHPSPPRTSPPQTQTRRPLLPRVSKTAAGREKPRHVSRESSTLSLPSSLRPATSASSAPALGAQARVSLGRTWDHVKGDVVSTQASQAGRPVTRDGGEGAAGEDEAAELSKLIRGHVRLRGGGNALQRGSTSMVNLRMGADRVAGAGLNITGSKSWESLEGEEGVALARPPKAVELEERVEAAQKNYEKVLESLRKFKLEVVRVH